MPVELTEALLSKAAGWEAMKTARAYLEQGQVLSSYWEAPLLRGVVQAGGGSFRASLVIKSPSDMENLCTCREAREWGKICAHVVAVGLHWLKPPAPIAAPSPAGLSQNLSRAPRAKTDGLRRDANGEPAELFVILPPNFEQAALRGKIMMVLEAGSNRGRCPLNMLAKDRAFAFSPADAALLDQIELAANGAAPAALQLETKDFAAWLPLLAEHPRVSIGRNTAVKVLTAPLSPAWRATLQSNGEILVESKDKAAPGLRVGEWLWRNNVFQRAPGIEGLGDLSNGPARISRAQVPQFLSQQWPRLEASAEANFTLKDFSFEPQAPRFLLELRGGLTQLTALLQCAYGPRIMTMGATDPGEAVWLPDPVVVTRYSTRDLAAERAAVGRLQKCGFGTGQGTFQLRGETAVLNFFARALPALEREWNVTLEARLERNAAQNIERIEPQFRISSGVQWFDFAVEYASSGGEKFSPADIQRLLLSGQSHTRLRNGKIAMIDTGAVEELQQTLLDCAPRQHADGYRINNAQAGFLETTLRERTGWKIEAPAAWRERAAKQSGETKLECPPLGELDAVLRPYQKHGVAWLAFLRENGFGGILADEMGLGKTLQTLAFLVTRPPGAEAAKPSLVVCPTSLVSNWIAEARKFTPQLRTLALHGPERGALFARIPEHDLIVTSYALARRDTERYAGREFDTVILDEAQHIKNRQTHNAQAVKSIAARHRFVLTGTPMENSVLDLWSIFDFLMPGYLGGAQDFRERYELPIAREKSEAAQARLGRRLRPFMLRRLKKNVAPDLPEKLEQVAFCELTEEQRGVYRQVMEAGRKEMLDAQEGTAGGKQRMAALNALLRLRQVCCDLRLLKLEGVNPAKASGKLDLFGELLEEAIDGGHRLLVFSQFVSMLSLIKERLVEEEIDYCYLDGATTDRAAVVERFQSNAGIPVFLISLKAGGVGLNLTGADTVIHFDPWWNPAVEDQATGRAHRIGQARVVTSYKLIARDTVEEKILALQNRKREIIEATVGGEEQFAASLTWEEIQDLLT